MITVPVGIQTFLCSCLFSGVVDFGGRDKFQMGLKSKVQLLL